MAVAEAIQQPTAEVVMIPLADLTPREDQPRQHFDREALATLAASIAAQGVQVPLRVRRDPAGGYDLLAGHRRRLASIDAGLSEVPCIVESHDDLSALYAVVTDNLGREDLLPHEEGAGYRALLHQGEDPGEVAERIGRTRDYVLDRVLISTLPDDILDKARRGEISSVKLLVELARLPEDPVPEPQDPEAGPRLVDPPPVDLRREAAEKVRGCGYQAGKRIIDSMRSRHALPGGARQEAMTLDVERIPIETVQARAGLDRRLSELSRLREWAVENAPDLGYLSPEQRASVRQQVDAAHAALNDIARAVRA